MADLHDPSQSGQGLLVDFLASEQFGIVEEVAQEPAQLPECFGRAVDATRDHASSKPFRFEDAESDYVERLLRMPSVLSLIDAHEEHTVGDLVPSRRSGFDKTLNAAFQATPSFSVRGRYALSWQSRALRFFSAQSPKCWTKFSTCSRVASRRFFTPQKSVA